MKKLVLALTIMFSSFCMAQDKIVTSEEEYNYLTQGYKISLETGSDFKAGYELKKIDEDKLENYSYSYSLLVHKESNKTKAVLITCKKDKEKEDKIVYLCLPFNNGNLFKKFCLETESLGTTMKMYFDYSMYNTLRKAMDKITNK